MPPILQFSVLLRPTLQQQQKSLYNETKNVSIYLVYDLYADRLPNTPVLRLNVTL